MSSLAGQGIWPACRLTFSVPEACRWRVECLLQILKNSAKVIDLLSLNEILLVGLRNDAVKVLLLFERLGSVLGALLLLLVKLQL